MKGEQEEGDKIVKRREKKEKEPQIGCERPCKTWPFLSSLLCILEKIKLTFFLEQINSAPSALLLFFKGSYKERKRRKGIREEGAFLPLCRVSCSTAEGTADW